MPPGFAVGCGNLASARHCLRVLVPQPKAAQSSSSVRKAQSGTAGSKIIRLMSEADCSCFFSVISVLRGLLERLLLWLLQLEDVACSRISGRKEGGA